MQKVVRIAGDGIGIEITEAVSNILEQAGAQIEWIDARAGLGAYEELGNPLPDKTVADIRENRLLLKGPLTTPVGTGFRSVNVALRQHFDLYANIRPARTLPSIDSPFKNVDMVIFRENTQGLYTGKEYWLDKDKKTQGTTSLQSHSKKQASILQSTTRKHSTY